MKGKVECGGYYPIERKIAEGKQKVRSRDDASNPNSTAVHSRGLKKRIKGIPN